MVLWLVWLLLFSVPINNHPTIKPLSLGFHIFNLFKLPIDDQVVYVPFGGVWSEVIPIIATGIKEENIIVSELSERYTEIGKARLEYWKKHNYYFKEKDKKVCLG